MARWLRWLALAMGAACAAIGLAHVLLGNGSVPGLGGSNATVDSEERFFGAVFVGYGLAWLWTARRVPIPSAPVRALAAIMLVGGLGRVLSMAVAGWPNWFRVVLTGIELTVPVLLLWLATADERAWRARVAAGVSTPA